MGGQALQLLEHQAKAILGEAGIPVPPGRLAATAEEAARSAREIGFPVAVKTQVPAGGRGKAGGVVRADSAGEAAAAFVRVTGTAVDDLLGARVLVEPWRSAEREMYLGLTIDPEQAAPVLLLGSAGGVDVEGDPAGRHMAAIPLDPLYGPRPYQVRRACKALGLADAAARPLAALAARVFGVFRDWDCVTLEINPLALVRGGELVALDARLVVDDAALFRQPAALHRWEESEPKRESEVLRFRHRLEYVRLGGSIGLISGGAGMTMAAMDLLRLAGGEAACFLDCSNNATEDGYTHALRLVAGDPRVHVILIHIFGGLTRMDRVAEAVLRALARVRPAQPVVIRLAGTGEERARAVLTGAGLAPCGTMAESVRRAVDLAAAAAGASR